MQPYVVRSGDHLASLSFRLGFDAEEVWSHAKNAELKQLRDPSQLHPGDVLWVPDTPANGLSITAGTTNRYAAAIPTTVVRLIFNGDDGRPLANEPFVIEEAGASQEGSTDANGALTAKVPVHTREIRVTFPQKKLVYPVRVGDMDPIEEPSGVRKRLENLGYTGPESDNDSEAETAENDRHAITAFQKAQGLEQTGTIDDDTRSALRKVHGS